MKLFQRLLLSTELIRPFCSNKVIPEDVEFKITKKSKKNVTKKIFRQKNNQKNGYFLLSTEDIRSFSFFEKSIFC
ncbi:hypothetical protein C4S04_00420 [Clostridioides difficile]|nr:hypothetical protein [Clostridioides difficile]MDB2942796.1 hypothetical protein [Clostridioides difficile]MDB3037220.1 hypothetical protein [Clostridioides difficile]MDB3589178.1 hypothetical protein [Clostridioides difficile]MDB3600432.1 hypothetical protein [Clostridioides difficile]